MKKKLKPRSVTVSEKEIRQKLTRANRELSAANEELSMTNEKLRTANEKLVATNEELRIETEEHRRMEEALRESESRLNQAQTVAGAGVWDWDISSDKHFWSDSLFRMFRLNPLKVKASFRSWRSISHPDDLPLAEKNLEFAIKKGTHLDIEYRIVLPSDEVRWIRTIADVVRDAKGKTSRLIGMCVDVTDRKLELESILDSSPAMIFYKDKENRLLRVNRTFAEAMHLSKEQMEGKSIFDLYPKEQAEASWKDDLEVIRRRKPKLGIIESMKTSQDTRIVEIHKVPSFGQDGSVTGVVGFAIDITELKDAEREVLTQRQRIHAIMEAVPVGVSFSEDSSCVTIKGNAALMAQFEMGPDDNVSASAESESAAGRKVRYFREGQELCADELPLQQAVRENRNIGPAELEILLPSGKRWFALASGAPILDNEGKIIGGVAVTEDITERKLMEAVLKRDKQIVEKLVDDRTRELLEVQLELERARRLSDIGTLSATVAHELRNPLAAMSMAAYNIERKAGSPELEKHLSTISKKIAESDQIINNLLFYSRLKPPSLETVNIRGLIEECVEVLEKRSRQKIDLIKDVDSISDITIEADPIQIREVFNNIFNNARDAVPSENPVIQVGAVDDEKFVKVSIEDNGPGIAKDIIDKIFDPFFTTKAKGTGLGLSVCRQIVGMHDGEITVKRGLTKGTCILVRLPKKQERRPAKKARKKR